MPRGPRIDIPGLIQHVICRGIERRDIFKDDKDCKDFLSRLSKLAGEERIKIYAFCLMPNHVHLLVRPLNLPLSTFMRKLLTGYAIYFNRRHRRAGHLFQNRYKSYVVEEDSYLLELIRYIHLNPVRAGIIDIGGLVLWPYSSHSTLMGRTKYDFYDAKDVLPYFSDELKDARKKLTRFMQDGLADKRRDDLLGGGLKRSLARLDPDTRRERQAYDERILGYGLFVERILKELDSKAKHKAVEITLDELLDIVATPYKLTVAEVCSGSRRASVIKARSSVVYIATKELGIAPKELSDTLNVGITTVYEIISSGRGKVESDGVILGK